MEERLSIRRNEPAGMNRGTLRLLAMILTALGMLSRGILQTRVLGIGTNTPEQLMQLLEVSGGMTAAAVAIGLQAVESCAVPVFAVLLVEGFQKTQDFKKYFLRVLGVAVISEIPFNYAISGKLLEPTTRNPVFGLALGLIMLYLYNSYAGWKPLNVLVKIMTTIAAMLWCMLFAVDYGVSFLIIVCVLWAFRERKTLRYFIAAAAAVSCCVGNPLFMFSAFGFLLVHYYNGEEGESNRVLNYLMYPILLTLVGLVGWLMF